MSANPTNIFDRASAVDTRDIQLNAELNGLALQTQGRVLDRQLAGYRASMELAQTAWQSLAETHEPGAWLWQSVSMMVALQRELLATARETAEVYAEMGDRVAEIVDGRIEELKGCSAIAEPAAKPAPAAKAAKRKAV